MISLPVIRRLSVDGYGLYPGSEHEVGLDARTDPGLTLILGANGLGKTTLVTILFRMLSGPFDIANIGSGRELGNRRIDAAGLSRVERRAFAVRVNDDAAEATANLSFSLGSTVIEVTRSLQNLELLTLSVDGDSVNETSEEEFQSAICGHAHLENFGDWILILRHLVFYFEDRRELVWDPTAQRELLRLLFLSIDDTVTWKAKSREILTRDSLVRNIGYAFRKEARLVNKVERKLGSVDEVRQQLELLEPRQQQELSVLEGLEDQLVGLDAARKQARLNALSAEQEHESAMRAVEQHQLGAIGAAFPSASETGKYLIGQILADNDCLACGAHVPEFAAELQQHIRDRQCVVCGSATEPRAQSDANVKRVLSQAVKKLEKAETRKLASGAERDSAEADFTAHLRKITELNSSTSARTERINELVEMLPPTEQGVHEQRSRLSSIEARYEQLSNELVGMRTDFKEFANSVNLKIAMQQNRIKEVFDEIAGGFLLEKCTLIWAPRKDRLGESGELIEFAAFELQMTGADFDKPVRRTGPQQVSESQREFIDLAFRMALMAAASSTGASLVVDAPESSLDAVFVTRAADVLIKFSSQNQDNRLIVTSNLIDGDLIPELLFKSDIRSSQDPRIVDLLEIAAPTAATAQLHDEYSAVRDRLFERARAR